MIKKALTIMIILSVALLLFSCGEETTTTETRTVEDTDTGATTSTTAADFEFETPKKSAHYETNTPPHGAVLAAVPINVVIDFNFDLAPPSEIKILKDGTDYGVGDTIIDDSKLAMRRNMDPAAPDGLYTVEYNACWPDGSCHDGYFQFAIDSTLAEGYMDMTGQSEVAIQMSQLSFQPQNIIINPGTTVTWTNMDTGIEHFVNTDSHPAHTYYPEMNSRGLMQGDSFSLLFSTPGIYLYHCSAHADVMKGSIIVS